MISITTIITLLYYKKNKSYRPYENIVQIMFEN